MSALGDGSDHGGAIVEIAAACVERVDFAREVLAWLDRSIGQRCAFIALPPLRRPLAAPGDLVCSGYRPFQLEVLEHCGRRFESELEPLQRAALRSGGVAVDTAVLGTKVERAQYYRELVAPVGGGHSMLCFLELRGAPVGLLVLGRDGAGFRDRDVERMRRMVPVLAVSLASYSLRAPSEPVLDRRWTPREREIASYLCLGYTNREIALALGTAENTVRNQLARLFRKAGASTRAELVGLLLRSESSAG